MEERIMRRPEIERVTGLSRSAIYAGMQQNRFPKPIKLGPRAVGWIESDIKAWIEEARSERIQTH